MSSTECTEHGQRLDRVQRVEGHKAPRSTQLYADMAEEQVWQALETGEQAVGLMPSLGETYWGVRRQASAKKAGIGIS